MSVVSDSSLDQLLHQFWMPGEDLKHNEKVQHDERRDEAGSPVVPTV